LFTSYGEPSSDSIQSSPQAESPDITHKKIFALAIATVQPLYLPFGVMVLKVGAVAAKGWILSLARYGDS
jgi:hypothetical protein